MSPGSDADVRDAAQLVVSNFYGPGASVPIHLFEQLPPRAFMAIRGLKNALEGIGETPDIGPIGPASRPEPITAQEIARGQA